MVDPSGVVDNPPHTVDPSAATMTLSDGDDDDDDNDTCPLLDLLRTDLFQKEVLERLDPTDRTMLAQVGRPWLAAVLASGLPRLPKWPRVRLQLEEFCTSGERLAWAKANGCPWVCGASPLDIMSNCCTLAAAAGHLEALQWARAHGCTWNETTCEAAARGGHLEVLKWAWEHDCPCDEEALCTFAAAGGNLEVLQWVREQDPPCPWKETCENAAEGAHLVGRCRLTLRNAC